MRTITYDETRYKLVPIDPSTAPEPKDIPQAMTLYYELAGIDADIEHGGLQAYRR